ncbi:MAG: MBOAT family protein [Bacteroidia bacterium]|nr:MBOAT family protein [Bacteroidia bacterium]
MFLIYWLTAHRYRWIILLVASYAFYIGWGVWYTLLLLLTTTLDYFLALHISDAKTLFRKKLYVTISIVANLLVLAGFKYFAFFYNSGIFLVNTIGGYTFNMVDDLLIPVGLSFYTFQSISYTVDVYRAEVVPERNLGKFALFVSFFPQLVAGPVERFSHLMPQLLRIQKISMDSFFSSIRLIIWGFFKKIVIADRLAEIVDPVFKDVESFSGSSLLAAGFLFVVQVYSDFSGYSDIATGSARLFGIELSLNWKRPLLSRSLIEFWKRNHISITSWFRNYLYISLGGSRCSYSRWLFNIFLVFLISGLWHGANWTFVFWGGLHGLVYIIELVINKRFPGLKFPGAIAHFYLLLFHTVSLIAFRAGSFDDLLIIYHRLFFYFNVEYFVLELNSIADLFTLTVNAGLIFFLFLKEMQEEYGWIKQSEAYARFYRPGFYLILLSLIFVFGNFNSNTFIYFRF